MEFMSWKNTCKVNVKTQELTWQCKLKDCYQHDTQMDKWKDVLTLLR